MRAVVQRVRNARVDVDGRTVGSIDTGLLVYLGIGREDNASQVRYVSRKVLDLRIFADSDGKMNLSLLDLRTHDAPSAPGVLVVSQFTLYADVRKGRRPSYNEAAPPLDAIRLYEEFLASLEQGGVSPQSGAFQEHMEVTYTNDGPVTIVIDTERDR